MPIRKSERARYLKDWKAISLRIRRDRAGDRCECEGECGTKHLTARCTRVQGGYTDNGGKVVLTVAHLDHTPEHCGDDNLKAMCQKCHLNYDSKHHQRNAAATRKGRKAAGDLFP